MFYSHLVEPWIMARHDSAPYIDLLENFTSRPMHMQHQGIGQISVPFFFLVSGFVVTPIAMRQGQARFSLNRAVRVYAPLAVAVAIGALILSLHLVTGPNTATPDQVTPGSILANLGLVNYLMLPQIALVPVAWTLIVEVFFYLLLIVLLPVLRRSVWFTIALELTFVFVALMSARQFGPIWFLAAVNISYLPILLIGQIIWAGTSGKIPVWLAGVYGAAAWCLYVLSDMRGMGRIDTSYNLALAFAVVLFGMGYFAESRLKERRFWIALSERSYSIYLLHMLVSFALLGLLRPYLPLPVCLVIAIVAVFGVVELSYRLVERPSHGLARRLSRRTPDRPREEPAEAAAAADAAEDTDDPEHAEDLRPDPAATALISRLPRDPRVADDLPPRRSRGPEPRLDRGPDRRPDQRPGRRPEPRPEPRPADIDGLPPQRVAGRLRPPPPPQREYPDDQRRVQRRELPQREPTRPDRSSSFDWLPEPSQPLPPPHQQQRQPLRPQPPRAISGSLDSGYHPGRDDRATRNPVHRQDRNGTTPNGHHDNGGNRDRNGHPDSHQDNGGDTHRGRNGSNGNGGRPRGRTAGPDDDQPSGRHARHRG